MSSGKWRPSCLGLNVLMKYGEPLIRHTLRINHGHRIMIYGIKWHIKYISWNYTLICQFILKALHWLVIFYWLIRAIKTLIHIYKLILCIQWGQVDKLTNRNICISLICCIYWCSIWPWIHANKTYMWYIECDQNLYYLHNWFVLRTILQQQQITFRATIVFVDINFTCAIMHFITCRKCRFIFLSVLC